jgi:hypothetical protein
MLIFSAALESRSGIQEHVISNVPTAPASVAFDWPATAKAWAWLGATLALALGFAWSAFNQFNNSPGPDLYHPWAIALPADSRPASSPYVAASEWGDVLNRRTLMPQSSAKLAFAGRYWQMRTAQRFEPTATPFYYSVFGFLPADYDRAQLVWIALQYVALCFGVYALSRVRGMNRLPALCTMLVVALTFQPFLYDVAVTNANAFQFAFLAGMICISIRFAGLSTRFDWLHLAMVMLLVAFKPNMLWVAAAFVMRYGVTWGTPRLVRAALRASLVLPFVYAAGAWYFHDAGIWAQWADYIGGRNGGTILYSIQMGNHALAQIFYERFGAVGPVVYSVLIALALAAALLITVVAGRGGRSPRAVLSGLFGDAWTAAGIGVVITLAAAPLIWYHYFVWALIPIFCFFRPGHLRDMASVMCLAAYVAMSVPALTLAAMTDAQLLYVVQTFPWVLLIPAMLLHVRRTSTAP